jgi:hypothetical protein
MGTLMAAFHPAGHLISPFAGVLIHVQLEGPDDRLWDVIRGAAVSLIRGGVWGGSFRSGCVFAAGVLLSVGGAVFGPASPRLVPDLVRIKGRNAISAFATVSTGANLIGSAVRRILFQALARRFFF